MKLKTKPAVALGVAALSAAGAFALSSSASAQTTVSTAGLRSTGPAAYCNWSITGHIQTGYGGHAGITINSNPCAVPLRGRARCKNGTTGLTQDGPWIKQVGLRSTGYCPSNYTLIWGGYEDTNGTLHQLWP